MRGIKRYVPRNTAVGASVSKGKPISKLYHLSFDQLPALEEQLMKLKSRSNEMRRGIISAMASAIGLCDVALLADRMGLAQLGRESLARNLQASNDHAATNGTDIARCKDDAASLARDLQGDSGTGIAGRSEGVGGGINKPLLNLFEDPSYLDSPISPKKNSIQETYADFGFRVVEMLEYWNEIKLEDAEWTESYKSYVLKNKESRSDLVQRLSEL